MRSQIDIDSRNFVEMYVPTQDDDTPGTCIRNQVKYPLPLPRAVSPLIHCFLVGYHLDARYEQPDFSRLIKLVLAHSGRPVTHFEIPRSN